MSPPPRDERDPLVRQLVQRVEAQEAVGGYVHLDDVRAVCDAGTVQWALAADLLLVDYRTGLQHVSGAAQPITLCRLNRHHPIVRALTAW